jgi:hypothetical protein
MYTSVPNMRYHRVVFQARPAASLGFLSPLPRLTPHYNSNVLPPLFRVDDFGLKYLSVDISDLM